MKTKKIDNIQKRSIEIIEYNSGRWKMVGSGWDLNLNEQEIDDAFIAWRNKLLKEECTIQFPKPRLLKN